MTNVIIFLILLTALLIYIYEHKPTIWPNINKIYALINNALLLHLQPKQWLLTDIDAAYDLVNSAACIYLFRTYKQHYDERLALKLAAAVVNELFGYPIHRQFAEENKVLINTKLHELKNAERFCHYVNIAVHSRLHNKDFAESVSPKNARWPKKLIEYGIIYQVKQNEMPIKGEELHSVANEFLAWVNDVTLTAADL